MFNLFTNLILIGCSDTGLNALPDEPSPETNECGCPDYTDKIAELETKINGLTDQLEHVQGDMLDNDARISAVEESSTSSSSLVVTEYDVDCGSATKRFDLLAFDGAYYPMNYIEDGTELSNSNWPRGCVVAKVDPLDPPWVIQQISVYDTRRGLSSTGGGGYEDPYALYGNPWYYDWVGGIGTPVRVHEDGYVLYDVGFEWDCSSGTFDADGDCPVTMPVVRVIIIDDKAYDPPSAW